MINIEILLIIGKNQWIKNKVTQIEERFDLVIHYDDTNKIEYVRICRNDMW